MNKNKTLLLILIALLIGLLLLNINRNGRFNKPDFDRTSEKINLDDAQIDITDFSYEVVDEDTMICHIEF